MAFVNSLAFSRSVSKRVPSMKMLKLTALVPLVIGLALSLSGCGDSGPPKAKETSVKEMEDSMKTMTLPKNPSTEKPAGEAAPAGDKK
jgi:hypothetical protein